MTALVLPGSIEGLIRRGSPVVHVEYGKRGVVAGADFGRNGEVMVAWDDGTFWSARLSTLALDLEDATGRAHAAWWLATQRGLRDPMASRWAKAGGAEDTHGNRIWLVTGYGCAPFRDAFDEPSECVVPTLAALNADDPRTLPDGSRWVDAEALRLVVSHVAGVTS